MNIEDFLNTLSEEQKQALAKALQPSEKSEPKIEPKEVPTTKVEVGEDFKVSRVNNTVKGARTPVKARKNQWEDEGEFKDIETPRVKKAPRNRERTKMIEVECHICGKTFSMNPNYVYGEFQRCSRCVGK